MRYWKFSESEPFILNMARYLLELSLVEYKMLSHTSSILAASALYLAMKIVKKPFNWNGILADITLYKE